MRAVVDTNILVRSIIKPQGSVGPVLQRLRRREYTLLLSRATLDELVDVLHRPRLRAKYSLTDSGLRAVIRLMVAALSDSQIVPVTGPSRKHHLSNIGAPRRSG